MSGWRPFGGWRGALAALATIAVALRLFVPPGFMPASAGGPFRLVICTGHGAMTPSGKSDHGPAKAGREGPCVFAAAGAAPPATSGRFRLAPGSARYRPAIAAGAVDLHPGRGLAAPPPPSQAPPVFL